MAKAQPSLGMQVSGFRAYGFPREIRPQKLLLSSLLHFTVVSSCVNLKARQPGYHPSKIHVQPARISDSEYSIKKHQHDVAMRMCWHHHYESYACRDKLSLLLQVPTAITTSMITIAATTTSDDCDD